MQAYTLRIDYCINGIPKSYGTELNEHNEELAVCVDQNTQRFGLTLHPSVPITLTKVVLTFPHLFMPDERLFLNGYQSWTDSKETDIHAHMPGLANIPAELVQEQSLDRYGDYRFTRYPALHGFTYAYIRRGAQWQLFGSLSERNGFTVFYFDVANHSITIEKDCENLQIDAPYEAYRLCLLTGDEQQVFDTYFAMMQLPKPTLARKTGYTTWYQHYQDIDRAIIQSNLDAMAAFAYPFDVFQIDDGYQTAVGDWLHVEHRKFPDGLKPIAGQIKARGMIPGLWLAPFCAQIGSLLATEHPDWLVKDAQGQPICCGSNWGGFYALDVCLPPVKRYLAGVFDVVVHQWGFELLKLDFLYAACVEPRPGKTRGQIMCEAMDLIRDCVGDKLIIGCGVPLGPAFGKVDFCRIGCDVSLTWDDLPHMQNWHRERVSTKNAIINTLFRRQLNGRAFVNDPDVLLLRDENLDLTAMQKEILAQINCLCGDLIFTSDNVAGYDPTQKEQLLHLLQAEPARIQQVDMDGEIVRLLYTRGEKNNQMSIDLSTGNLIAMD